MGKKLTEKVKKVYDNYGITADRIAYQWANKHIDELISAMQSANVEDIFTLGKVVKNRVKDTIESFLRIKLNEEN